MEEKNNYYNNNNNNNEIGHNNSNDDIKKIRMVIRMMITKTRTIPTMIWIIAMVKNQKWI